MDASSAADLVSSHDVVRFVEARVETSGDDIALAFSMPLSSAFSVLSKLARDGRILRLARGRFGGRES
jgi:hypothetical protein